MRKLYLNVRTKLLVGFITILFLAGIAGFMGITGIDKINFQNRIGVILDDVIETAQNAQEDVYRYILYTGDDYFNSSIENIEKVIDDAETAAGLMTRDLNRKETQELILRIKEYITAA